MGKKDGGNRTKGNTKPSSSARSAELLLQSQPFFTSGDGSDLLTTSEFGSGVAPIFGLTSLNPEEEANIPSQMKMAIRKMTKKDATTRLKAVQEFTEMCEGTFIDEQATATTSNEELAKAAVKAVLPFWPRLYQRLAIDVDRRVREAGQKAHLVMIGIVGRDLAPHLKALAPAWYLSRADPHPPAAVLADKSFSVAFPTTEKRRNAILFCQTEILAHIHDNLSNQNANSLSDAKTTDSEDMDSKYYRVLSSSLISYCTFLTEISQVDGKNEKEIFDEYLRKNLDQHVTILSHSHFWKLSGHKNSSVRTAWYSVANIICQKMLRHESEEGAVILEPKLESKLASLILGKLDESDPTVASLIWESSLYLTQNSRLWVESVNVEKQVMPKVISVLEGASHKGQVNPFHVYPNILPLISQLIPKLVSTWKEEDIDTKLSAFYSKLLNAVHHGLEHFLSLAPKSSGQQLLRKGGSSNAAKMAVETYFDCVLFGITSDYRHSVAEIIQTRIIEWISEILKEPTGSDKHLESEILFQSLANFVWAMEKKVHAQTSEKPQVGVEEFHRNILNKITELTMKVYDEGEKSSLTKTSHFLTFLIGNPAKFSEDKKEKKGGLKFQDEMEKDVGKCYLTSCFKTQSKERSNETPNVCFESLPKILQETLVKMSSRSIEKVLAEDVDSDARNHVLFLTQILECFSSDSGVSNFYSQLLKNPTCQDGAVDLLQAVAHSKLLNEVGENNAQNEGLVDFCLVIARAVNSDSKLILYENLFERSDERKVTDWLLASLLKAEEDGSLPKRSILSGNGFANKIRSICNGLPDNHPEYGTGTWTLVAIALKNSHFLPDVICDCLLSSFATAIHPLSESVSSKFSRLVQFLFDLFLHWEESSETAAGDLITTPGGQLFLLELFKVSGSRREAFRVDFTALWTQALKATIEKTSEKSLLNEILSKMFFHVKGRVETEINEELTFQAFSLLGFLKACEGRGKFYISWQSAWVDMLPQLVTDGANIESSAENSFLFTLSRDVHLTVVQLRNEKMSAKKCEKQDRIINFFLRTAASVLLNSESKVKLIPSLMEYLAVTVTYRFPEGKETSHNLIKVAEQVFNESLTSESKNDLKEVAFKKSMSHGWNWSLALNKIMTWLHDDPQCKSVVQIGDLVPKNSLWSEAEVHTLQVLMKFSSPTELRGFIQTEVGCLLSLQSDQDNVKSRMTVSLVLLVSAYRHLDLENDIELKESLKSVLELIAYWRQTKEEEFLYAINLADKSFDDVIFVASVCEFLQLSVDILSVDAHVKLESTHWDLILCSLSSWIQSVDESSQILNSLSSAKPAAPKSSEVTSFSVAVIQLASVVAQVIDRISKLENRSESENQLLEEWQEFFSDGIFSVLINLFVVLANIGKSQNFSKGRESLLVSLGNSLRLMPSQQLQTHKLPAKYIADDLDSSETTNFPENLVFILNHLVPMLSCDRGSFYERRSIQTTAYKLLTMVMDKVVECQESSHEKEGSLQIAAAYKARAKSDESKSDDVKDKDNDDDDDDDIEEMCELPRRMTDQLNLAEPVLQALFTLSDLPFGEPLPTSDKNVLLLPTDSQSYIYTMSLLLTWKLILKLIALASSELRPKVSEFLRRRGHIDTLMETMFHLMTLPKDLASGSPSKTKRSFGSEPPLPCILGNDEVGEELKELSASVYYGLLRDLPALIRSWWNSADKRTAILVDKFTTNEASPVLWAEEAQRISSSKSYENMTTKVRSSVREVVATYTLDEGSMELVIKVPQNFPLGPVSVESGKKIGVTTSQWRTWMLQLTTFLQHQNGSVVDGLAVWKKNLDKRFDGVEECYICFYILHGSSHQLPKLACRTCKKKFHSACLYKWFNTSNNSTCPLCRNLF